MSQKIQIPETVVEIIQELELNGYSAYLVGGYVRDQILNSENESHFTEDFDIATSSTPEEIKKIFPDDKIFAYGERHGTVTLRRSGINFEITTFREEEGYSDGRRPDKVTFIRDLSTDLARRDFTVNAFALDKDGSIIDYYNGLEDLKKKLIRAVGDPVKRLQEDSLRIFRAVRFAVKLGFNIEERTKKAIQENRHLILDHQLSGERIFSELNNIMSDLPRGVMLLHELDLLTILFPEYVSQDNIDWLFQLLKNRKYLTNQPTSEQVDWAILLHYIFEDILSKDIPQKVKDIFLRYPGMKHEKVDYIIHLIVYVRSFYNIVNLNIQVIHSVILSISENLNVNADPKLFFQDLIQLLTILDDRWGIRNINNLKTVVHDFVPTLNNKLPLNGNDLVSIGYNGKSISLILQYLKMIFTENNEHDKFHLLDSLNKFDFNRNRFNLIDFISIYNLEPTERLDDFVMESLISRMKIEYLLLTNPDQTVVIEIDRKFTGFIKPFLIGIGGRNVLINSQVELPENVIKDLDAQQIRHIRFKYHTKNSIEALLDLTITDPNTIIFNLN